MADDPTSARRVKLSDLCDDMLMEIFARLPVNKLLAVERVSRTWKRCVGPMLNRVEVVVFECNASRFKYDHSTCSNLQLSCHNRQTLYFNVSKFDSRIFRNRINDENVDAIIKRLTRCPLAKRIDLSEVTVCDKGCLMQLINVFPDLNSLCLGSNLAYGHINEVDWRKFAEEIAPKLVYFEFCPGSSRMPMLYDKDLSLLLTGDRLRSVHLSFSKFFSPESLVYQLRRRPQVELSLDVEWLQSQFNFSGFSRLKIVVKELTWDCKSFFRAIDWDNREILKVKEFTNDDPFLRKSTFVFKKLKILQMQSVWLDENTFKCSFERLETLHLIDTSATDDADFANLFGSMQQLKNLVIRLNHWIPTRQYFPGQSLTALKLLKSLEIEMDIKFKEKIRMTNLFNFLIKMLSLKRIKITCYFHQYLVVPIELKKELVFNITTLHWSLPTAKIDVELRLNKKQFAGKAAIDEVMDWYSSVCHFEQISEKYTEEEDFHKVEIKPIESRMSISNVTSIDNLDFHKLTL